ncbi:hypothetical protein MMYC01_207443 [Madurella mycetomatis]|uniref:Fungal-specific transcription factor domain-containing protein n=1 Tax=Madurella mycetomatis TaxID=100816 RepID=A0A175VW68_9PEZI|nr:hypothetical protein MMYC01_207443 [Madurella mycetomatis]
MQDDTGAVNEPSCTSPDLEVHCPIIQNRTGPALRLSWPRGDDGRRAIVGKLPPRGKKRRGPHAHATRIVHVSHQDVEMHYHFTGSVVDRSAWPTFDIPLAWDPRKLEVGHRDLFEYFQRTASRSLATFGYDPTELGNVLTKLALASNKPSATAVLQSLLAFSALHRHDVYSQAVELKISAIKALTSVSGSDIGTAEAIQHVAAGMLLCSFEIHRVSCTSGEWTWYLRGVKHIIQAAGLTNTRQDNDLAMLLDWVYYHDVLARFSLRHWHREPAGNPRIAPGIRAEVSHAAPPSLALIGLLSEVSDLIPAQLSATTPTEDTAGLKSLLTMLDWRIRTVTATSADGDAADSPLIMELYRLSMLVYLNRASGNLLNQSSKTQNAIDKAFSILSVLGSCERQFPVFILGCEARSDDQRAVVLDLVSRTERNVSSRSFNYVRLLLQAIWAQDDLGNGNTNYWDRLSYVISCCRIMPPFV